MPARYENSCTGCKFICSHGKWDVWTCGGTLFAKENLGPGYWEWSDGVGEGDSIDDAFMAARKCQVTSRIDPSVSPNARADG